jgi:hypothetical protein
MERRHPTEWQTGYAQCMDLHALDLLLRMEAIGTNNRA